MEYEIMELRKQLSAEEMHQFDVVYNTRKKSKLLAYFLLFIGFGFSAHRFYLKSYLVAALVAISTASAILLNISIVQKAAVIIVAFVTIIDLYKTSSICENINQKIQLTILKEIFARRSAQAAKMADPENIIKESPQILSELSLNNNRLFSLKGDINNKEIKECIDALYNTLKIAVDLIKSGKIESYKLEKISKFYLPELIGVLSNYQKVEANSYSPTELLDTNQNIKLVVNKIENSLSGVVREISTQKHDDINLGLEVLRKAMAIEGIDDNGIY